MGWILFRSDLFARVALLRARFVASRTLVQSGLLGFKKKQQEQQPGSNRACLLGFRQRLSCLRRIQPLLACRRSCNILRTHSLLVGSLLDHPLLDLLLVPFAVGSPLESGAPCVGSRLAACLQARVLQRCLSVSLRSLVRASRVRTQKKTTVTHITPREFTSQLYLSTILWHPPYNLESISL